MQSVVNWQAAWDNSSKGRWTHQLIPSIETWLNRKHGQVDFYLTQALSGHGCFRIFLKRFGHDTEDGCPECGSGIVEDAQNVLFECRRFGYDRQILMETTGAPHAAEGGELGSDGSLRSERTANAASHRPREERSYSLGGYHCVKQYLAVIPRNHGPLLLFLFLLLLVYNCRE